MAFRLKPLKDKQIFVLIDSHSARLLLVEQERNNLEPITILSYTWINSINLYSASYGTGATVFTLHKGKVRNTEIKKHAHCHINSNGWR